MSMKGHRHKKAIGPVVMIGNQKCNGLTAEQIAIFFAAIAAARKRRRS